MDGDDTFLIIIWHIFFVMHDLIIGEKIFEEFCHFQGKNDRLTTLYIAE